MATRRPHAALAHLKDKIRSTRLLTSVVRQLKRQGRRVVFTNGCFDLLHVGHVSLLEQAKRLGDVLIVALNSDRSVRALKGPARPLVRQDDRALVLAALSCVDYITIFDERTPQRLITELKPDILVKGADWSAGKIVGADAVRRAGGRVVRVQLVDGYSTTKLVQRIGQGTAPSS